MVSQVPLPVSIESQNKEKVSKGVKAYPDGWRKVLNNAKDNVRSGLLLKEPFPTSKDARVSVTEAFHETHTAECNNGTVLEPGASISTISSYASIHTTTKQVFRSTEG